MIKEKSCISTQNGNVYIKRLCKHFSHKVPATFTENEGTTEFPFGNCIMKSNDDQLIFVIEADSEEKSEKVKKVLIDHLNTFSRDENLDVSWEREH